MPSTSSCSARGTTGRSSIAFRRGRTVPRASSAAADGDVDIQPARSLDTSGDDAAHPRGGPVSSAMDRRRVGRRRGRCLETDGARHRVRGPSDRAPPDGPYPLHVLLARGGALGRPEFRDHGGEPGIGGFARTAGGRTGEGARRREQVTRATKWQPDLTPVTIVTRGTPWRSSATSSG